MMRSTATCLAFGFLLFATPYSEAMTGKDLFAWCAGDNAVENASCMLYITGFVHGMKSSKELNGIACLPDNLTGLEATEIFTRTMRNIGGAAVSGKAAATEANPFFIGPPDAAVAAALGMQFKCPAEIKVK
jgi:hypothetical protein